MSTTSLLERRLKRKHCITCITASLLWQYSNTRRHKHGAKKMGIQLTQTWAALLSSRQLYQLHSSKRLHLSGLQLWSWYNRHDESYWLDLGPHNRQNCLEHPKRHYVPYITEANKTFYATSLFSTFWPFWLFAPVTIRADTLFQSLWISKHPCDKVLRPIQQE